MEKQANKGLSEFALTKQGEAYLKAAEDSKKPQEGYILTQHEGTTLRIDIRHITDDQAKVLFDKKHVFIRKKSK